MRVSSRHILATSLGLGLGGCSALVETNGLHADDPAIVPDGGTNASPAPDRGTSSPEGGTTSDSGSDGGEADSGGGVPILAQDAFARSVTGGLGAADIGGFWQLVGNATPFSVADGVGHITLSSATARSARLPIASDDTDLTMAIATNKTPSGATAYFSVIGRAIDSNNDYRCRAVVEENGTTHASVATLVGGSETKLQDSIDLFAVSGGDIMRVRCQVTGRSPTKLRVKLWKSTDSEPTNWSIDTTDATSSLQAKGGVGVYVYVDTIANGPLDITLDDLLARPASLLP